MGIHIGDDIRAKATNKFGKLTATNGHAHKMCGQWFYMDELEAVVEETGSVPIDGEQRNYTLFHPVDLAQPRRQTPRPALLFVHGLTGDRSKHRGLARRLCQSLGLLVMVPDVVPLMSPFGLEEDACISEVTAHAKWLANRGDVDSKSIILGGFSAGGAAALEVAADLQQFGMTPAALVLLDPVPWARTSAAAERLAHLPGGILALLSEPSMLTKFGAFQNQLLPLLAAKNSVVQDLRHFQVGGLATLTVNSAQHVDAESADMETSEESSKAASASLSRALFDLFAAPADPQRARTFCLFVEAFLSDVLCTLHPSDTVEKVQEEVSTTMVSALWQKLEKDVRIDASQELAEPSTASITQALGNMLMESASEKPSRDAGCPTQ